MIKISIFTHEDVDTKDVFVRQDDLHVVKAECPDVLWLSDFEKLWEALLEQVEISELDPGEWHEFSFEREWDNEDIKELSYSWFVLVEEKK